jgi:predicted DNA-binding protein (UPF0251 family)
MNVKMGMVELEAQRLLFIEECKQKRVLTSEEEATLEIYMDAESFKSVIEACESARCKPLHSLETVFRK